MHSLPATTLYILIGSVFLVLFIGFTVFFILYYKARKLRKKIIEKNVNDFKNDKKLKAIFERDNAGEMIWDLKEHFKNPIDDFTLDFFITTIMRNAYSKVWIENKNSGYEAITIALKTKTSVFLLKKSILDIKKFEKLLKEFHVQNNRITLIEKKNIKDKFDLIIISEETIDFNIAFDNTWANVNKKGLLIISNCKKLSKNQKDLVKYMKLVGIRFEHQKVNEGFIIAAK